MTSPDTESLDLARVAAKAADDKLGTDVIILDVGNVLSITGYFVVASAGNTRQVRTIADEVEKQVKEQLDRAPGRTEGVSEGQWVLLDYGDVVVHVFSEDTRRFYEIERLYSDVPKVDWRA
jgi:ribosome-associated protein